MDPDHVRRWIVGYEQAWRSPGTTRLVELFTEDASYLQSPWGQPKQGLTTIAKLWDAERDSPDEGFTMRREIVALDTADAVAVVRVEVDYAEGSHWRDLWIIRFAPDGRCRSFEEWPFAQTQ